MVIRTLPEVQSEYRDMLLLQQVCLYSICIWAVGTKQVHASLKHVVLQNLVNSTKQQLVSNRELVEHLEHTTAAEPHTETAVYNAFKNATAEWVG